MKEKQLRNIIVELKKRALLSSRKCLYNGCQSPAIESHLLQRNGIINQIAEPDHVWTIGIDDFKPGFFFFKKIGVKEAFSFRGFCSKHDNELFKEIETITPNFLEYRTQLLLSYRSIIDEMRKKEILIDFYKRILGSFTIKTYATREYLIMIKESLEGSEYGIKDELFFEKYFLSNISDPLKRDFKFITYELPRIEICSSAVFTYETTAEINYMLRHESYKEEKPLTEIYFNLLPLQDKSIVIIGCLAERANICWDYVQGFKCDSPQKSLKKLSDLFLCQVENWLCSDTFFSNQLKHREPEIIKIVHESQNHPNERRELGFNMFSE